MDPATKYDTIRFVRDELYDIEDQRDVELLLNVFGFEATDYDFGVQDSLLKGSDEALLSLASKLRGEKGLAEPDGDGTPGPLRVFASHLSASKLYVSQFRDLLKAYGIELFVAHSSIKPSSRWADVIEENLRTCHAGVIFLEPESKNSDWCDQEVGWLLGRGIPLYTLMLDGARLYGALAEQQAVPASTDRYPGPLVDSAVEHFRSESSIAPYLTESLVQGLIDSFSWDNTRRVWEQIRHLREIRPDQIERIEAAIPANQELRAASVTGFDGKPDNFPAVFARFKTEQAGYQAPSWAGWGASESPF